MNDFTGLVVRSEREYSQALEHLYHDTYDRMRIGRNAAEYARQIFGAEHAARKFNPILERMMRADKRSRAPFGATPAQTTPMPVGAARFVESLRNSKFPFARSAQVGDIEALFDADASIINSTTLMKRGGVKTYRRFHSTDPYLCFWSGLASLGEGQLLEALSEFVEALKHNFPHWRPWWYVAQVSAQLGQVELARQSVAQVRALAPEFQGAQQLEMKLHASP